MSTTAGNDPDKTHKLGTPLTAVDALRESLPLGSQWGHLRIESRLGEGAFGEVFVAHDTTLHRDVALKLQRLDNEDDSSHYIDEARRLARVRHPNVLAVHGADVYLQRVGLWADLLRGQTLAERLTELQTLPRAAVLELGGQLAAALAAVHGSRLSHGDIKPANIMCEADGRYVLMDFGAAREINRRGETHHYGTPRFMSPERLRLGLPPTEADDLYALGVLLFLAALGRFPSADRSADQRALRSALGRPLAQLVSALLSEDPQLRPTATAVRERYRYLLELPRRRRQRVLIGAVIGSLGVGLLAALFGLFTAQQATLRESQQRERAEAVSGFLHDWLSAPRAEAQGRQVRVLDVLGDAERELQARPPTQLDLRSELRLLLAQTLYNLGELERAALLAGQVSSELVSAATDSRDALLWLHAEALLASIDDDRGQAAPAAERRRALLQRLQGSRWAGGELQIRTLIEQADQQISAAEDAAAQASLDQARQLIDRLTDASVRRELSLLLSTAELGRLTSRGDFSAAAEVAEQALQQAIALHGEHHSSVFVARNRWVEALAQGGRLDQAEAPARENLAAARDWLGDEDRYTLAALVALGNVLDDGGRHGEALDFRREAVLRADRLPGASPTDRAQARINLANSLKELGQRPEAIERYREVADGTAEINPIVRLMAASNLAEALVEDGQFAAAAERARATAAAMQQTLGDAHPFVGHARAMLGAALCGLGRAGEGRVELDAARQIVADSMGSDNPLALDIDWYRALALAADGDNAGARAAMQGLREQQLQLYGSDHPDLIRTEQWLRQPR